MKRYFLLYFLLIFVLFVQGQTIVPGGYVSGTWEFSQSPFYIQGDIEIHYDSILIIEPGVDVFFDGSFKLTVHGLINATGNETDSILFTATDPTTGWKGIEFYQSNENLGTSYLQYCILTYGNKSTGSGGAIYVYESDEILINHCRIEHNYADHGGGIYIDDGWIDIKNCVIKNNSSKYNAGGISCLSSVPYFYNLQITNNSGGDVGGVFFGSNPSYSYPYFEDLNISNNSGGKVGGLYLEWSNTLILDKCKINNNQGMYVGGIALIESSLEYWGYPAEKNQVYMNKGGIAQELYFEGEGNTIMYIDTFTVINPDSYLAYPLDKFNFIDGIEYGLIEQADTNLYISETGSDSNDGLTPQSPLRSFDYALRKIISNNENNNTLWVLPGHYHLNESDSANPIYIKDDVQIVATVQDEAIIDADSLNRVFYAYLKNNFKLSGLTIKNGYIRYLLGSIWGNEVSGGGLYIYASSGVIDSCNFISNYSNYFGGGVFLEDNYNIDFNHCKFVQNSAELAGGGIINYYPTTSARLNIINCEFRENQSNTGGGGAAFVGDKIKVVNCLFDGNISVDNGAGCVFQDEMPDLVNCQFTNNNAGGNGGGCCIVGGSNAKMVNCTFSDNVATKGTAIYMVYTTNQKIINSITWNASVSFTDMIHIKGGASCYINYSDIQGGEEAIVLEGAGSHYYWQDGNITDYPAYIDPANQDYSLNWNSPCIEAGKEDTTGLHLPLVDLNGDPRLVNTLVDMGAYEYQLPVYVRPEKPFKNKIDVYPVVANTTVNVEFPSELEEAKLNLRLFSSAGFEVKSLSKPEGQNKIQMEISGISSGVYFLLILDSKRIINTSKVIIVK